MTQLPRVAIFGVGRMGLVHLEHLVTLARNGAIELVAIGDRHPPVLDHARRMLVSLPTLVDSTRSSSTRTFMTPEAMADECHLDACVVASRTEDHAHDTLALASRGVAVLVEKPMAQTVAEAASFDEQLGALGAQRDRVQIAFQRHYDAAARAAMQRQHDEPRQRSCSPSETCDSSNGQDTLRRVRPDQTVTLWQAPP